MAIEVRESEKSRRKKELESKLAAKLKMPPEELIELAETGDVRLILRELLLYVYK